MYFLADAQSVNTGRIKNILLVVTLGLKTDRMSNIKKQKKIRKVHIWLIFLLEPRELLEKT